MSSGNTDVIFYEARTSRVHQDHIIVHELVHLVAGHKGVSGPGAAMRAPRGDASGPDCCLRRHGSGDAQEIEAEAVAAMALGWRSSLNPRAWTRSWRTYRDLAPLWLVLRSACPQDSAGRKLAPSWPPWQMHRRAYRRLIECRDGLVRIGQYLGSGPYEDRGPAGRLFAEADMAGPGQPAPWSAEPIAIPRSSGLDADVDALVSLSKGIGKSGFRRRRLRGSHPARFG